VVVLGLDEMANRRRSCRRRLHPPPGGVEAVYYW
jgi:hypothetical protein